MTLPTEAELERRTAELLAAWRVRDTAVAVRWNRRLSSTAGRAFQRSGRIELNPTLLARAPAELPMVLAHEAAHIAAFRLFGPNVAAHGRHWRSLMRLAGHEPAVTHDIPVDDPRLPGRPRRRRFLYLRVCEGCGDRRLLDAVRYGRCHGCEARDRYLVVKSSAGPRGRAALERLTLADVRALHRSRGRAAADSL
ncbi:MAG: SprT-like domain-containing protein [Planctomycetes bacterium]|nr:SprT-like domain-containing protein [Planctomycetota bacterium]